MGTIFTTSSVPKPIGPYSLYTVAGDLIFLSGQVGLDGNTGKIVQGGIKEQTTQACRNIKSILFELGLGLKDVVKTTIFLRNMDHFAEMNDIYKDYFVLKPARSTVEVSKLPQIKTNDGSTGEETLIEIECIVQKPKESVSRNAWGVGRSI